MPFFKGRNPPKLSGEHRKARWVHASMEVGETPHNEQGKSPKIPFVELVMGVSIG
jgi:hypothetical protein